MAIAKILLKNDVGLVLDITESPLGCTVYDLEGNEISAGENLQLCNLTVINETGEEFSLGINNITDSGLYASYVNMLVDATVTVKAIYQDDGDIIYIDLWDIDNYTKVFSNNVNCTFDQASVKIEQTEPGQSSATLTLS